MKKHMGFSEKNNSGVAGPEIRLPPGCSLRFLGWANAKNTPRKGDPWGQTQFEGIVNDVFHRTHLSAQEIKDSTPKKCSVGWQDTNEHFIAQFEQKSAQIFV